MDDTELLNYDTLATETSKIDIPESSVAGIPNRGKLHGTEIVLVITAAIIFAISTYVYRVKHAEAPKVDNKAPLARATNNNQPIIDPFKTVEVKAQAVYVWDILDQKPLYSKNEQLALPLASLTKVMTANTALDVLAPTSTIYIEKEALSEDGDSGLYANEKWSFKNLLNFTLTVSSNDGAAAISSAAGNVLLGGFDASATDTRSAFVSKMNAKAKEIGLTSTQFFNETGLDLSLAKSGAYGSAQDVAKLFEYTLDNHPEVLENTKYTKITVASQSNINHTAVNTDIAIDKIPGIMGSKTGFSDLAGGNLAVIYDAGVNHPVVAVVLGSTYQDRFTDMVAIIKAANEYLSSQN